MGSKVDAVQFALMGIPCLGLNGGQTIVKMTKIDIAAIKSTLRR